MVVAATLEILETRLRPSQFNVRDSKDGRRPNLDYENFLCWGNITLLIYQVLVIHEIERPCLIPLIHSLNLPNVKNVNAYN